MLYINSRFLTQNLTGVQRFGFEISKQLAVKRDDVQGLVNISSIRANYPIGQNYPLINVGKGTGHLWEQYDLPLFLKKKGNPLLLGLCSTGPLLYKNQIVTIHDLAFLNSSWHSFAFRNSYKTFLPILANKSKHVLTVSEFSKSELKQHFGIPEEKITVIYNAPFKVSESNNLTAPLLPEKPYILSVGSIDPRKNLKRLIKAFCKLNNPDILLLLIGANNQIFTKDKELYELLENNKNIALLGYKTDAELKYYYENALFFIYPALYEGFGLPPIEAMSFGCPVIVSERTSLPEVCGKAALYCDPENIDDIHEKISYLLANHSIRNSMIEPGRLQAAKFSWEQSVNKLNLLLNKFI